MVRIKGIKQGSFGAYFYGIIVIICPPPYRNRIYLRKGTRLWVYGPEHPVCDSPSCFMVCLLCHKKHPAIPATQHMSGTIINDFAAPVCGVYHIYMTRICSCGSGAYTHKNPGSIRICYGRLNTIEVM